jgi:hypothetical protein
MEYPFDLALKFGFDFGFVSFGFVSLGFVSIGFVSFRTLQVPDLCGRRSKHCATWAT